MAASTSPQSTKEHHALHEFGPFQLWREDTHGNRFFVAAFLELREAEAALSRLSECVHKQHYFITDNRGERQHIKSH